MKLEELKESQMEEIMEWADTIEQILTPDALTPTKLKDFPLFMETSERLKRICKWKAAETKQKMQSIADALMVTIEQEEYIFKFNSAGMAVTKKRYNSIEKRERELRRQLAASTEYTLLDTEHLQWDMMFSDWVSHINRLRREMHILELEYSSTGTDNWERDAGSLNSNKNK